MKKNKLLFCVMTVILLCLTTLPYLASTVEAADAGVLLAVIDSSKESYGSELREEVSAQLKKQLQTVVKEEYEFKDVDNLALAERSELLELAKKSGLNQVLVIEILPLKSDFKELLFYKAIQSEATLRIRLYDAIKNQYLVTGEASGRDTNKTYIPYTSVGKKPTVLKATRQAATAAAQKINQHQEAQ